MCEEGEVGETWIWVVEVTGFDVAGTSNCIEHGWSSEMTSPCLFVCVFVSREREREREGGGGGGSLIGNWTCNA